MPEIISKPNPMYRCQAPYTGNYVLSDSLSTPEIPVVTFKPGELTALELSHARLTARTKFPELLLIAERMIQDKITYREAFLALRNS